MFGNLTLSLQFYSVNARDSNNISGFIAYVYSHISKISNLNSLDVLCQPGDFIFWKRQWRKTALEPQKRRPHQVLLTYVTAVWLQYIDPWLHGSQLKRYISVHPDYKTSALLGDLKLWILRNPPKSVDFRGGQLLSKMTGQVADL